MNDNKQIEDSNSYLYDKKDFLEEKKEEGKQQREKRQDNIGKLGTWFGSSKNAPINISGILTLSLISFAILFTVFSKEFENAKIIWVIVTPIITLALGYIFGKQQ